MAKRNRDVPVLFWVSAEELELIHQKMQQYGTENLSAYLRKMALDGYVVKLDLPELKELVSLMRRSSNNLNQLTRKVHETGRVYRSYDTAVNWNIGTCSCSLVLAVVISAILILCMKEREATQTKKKAKKVAPKKGW